MTQLLPSIQLESAPNPTAAVIWLHGLGADGNDFAALTWKTYFTSWFCALAWPVVVPVHFFTAIRMIMKAER